MPTTRRPHRRLIARAVLGLSLLLTVLPSAGSANAVSAPYGSCAAFQVIAVRGTGEVQPAGWMLPSLVTEITNRTSKTVLAYGLPYPATSDWANSVNAGTSQLADRMAISSYYCPAQRFVLVGYSQGAWVVGDALAGTGGGATAKVSSALGNKVAAVVLYGDPRFRYGESYDAGTFRTGVSGVIARDRSALSAYAGRIRSYCYVDDSICQNGAAGSGHSRYAQGSTADAAAFTISKIGT